MMLTCLRCVKQTNWWRIAPRYFSSVVESPSKWDQFGVHPLQIHREDQVPRQTDVLIVGGGLIGWSVAFWMRWTTKYSVTVVERDPTYSRSASVLGLGSIRQQFSEPENIQMSLFTSEFLRNIRDYLSVLDDTPLDIGFNPQGCLLLAKPEQAEQMKQNYELQCDLGAKVKLYSKSQLEEQWPWLNVEDIELGCYGYENEGWFDPWLLLQALRAKSHALGVNYVVGEVVEFLPADMTLEIGFPDMPKRAPVIGLPIRYVVVALPDFSRVKITTPMVVNAAGPAAADVCNLAEVGNTSHLKVPMPVEPRLRPIFVVRPNGTTGTNQQHPHIPGLDIPFLIDPDRLFVERRGLSGEFIVYSDDPDLDTADCKVRDGPDDWEVDHNLLKSRLINQLAHRISSLSNAEVTSAWTAVCDYNTVDQNLIIGHHPFHVNMYFCNGSSGHGSQHCIAIGRAISELIIYGHYKTIDLTRFSFDRLYLDEIIKETNSF